VRFECIVLITHFKGVWKEVRFRKLETRISISNLNITTTTTNNNNNNNNNFKVGSLACSDSEF
jgi:hypothetical protein